MLVANVLDLRSGGGGSVDRETLGTQEVLGYKCEVFRYRNPVTPGWGGNPLESAGVGAFPLKKLERIVKGGVIISEILVEVIEFNVGPIPPEILSSRPIWSRPKTTGMKRKEAARMGRTTTASFRWTPVNCRFLIFNF